MWWSRTISKSDYKKLVERLNICEELVERHYQEHRRLRGFVYGGKRVDISDDDDQQIDAFVGKAKSKSYDRLNKDQLRTQLQREGRLRAGRE